MPGLLLLAALPTIWYMVPLIVSVSLVYAATRHEYIVPILKHAVRFGMWISLFMGGVLVIFSIMSWAVSG
jgi:hypothetical protein